MTQWLDPDIGFHEIRERRGAQDCKIIFCETDIYYICPDKTVLPLKEGNIFKIWTQTQINCVRDICGGDTSFIFTQSTNFSTVHIVYFVQYDDTVSFMTL